MWHTRFTEILGIDQPIIQGGMAWCSTAELAAAVSNAGGLGVIAAGSAPAQWVEEQINKAKMLTDKPFAVNIMLMSPFAAEIAELVIKCAVKCVITGAGNPVKFIKGWKDAGIKVIPVVPTVALGRKMQQLGADAVVGEGCEAGGHIGELTTMALVPQLTDVLEIPVIAAGGIADGRGMAAAFMLGAEGVQIGTRFLCASECTIHENYKQKIISSNDTATMVTGRRGGAPVRAIKNKMSREMLEKEKDENATLQEIEEIGVGALRRAAVEGDTQYGSLMAGQISGLVKEIMPANDIIQEITVKAKELLKI